MNQGSHEPLSGSPDSTAKLPSPPGRIWAIGVLVLSALVSMSMNTVHAFDATTLPKPLALMYGVAPVALAAMQSHAVALRALRKEKVGFFRKGLTFGLVLGGLGLSFLGIYDLLRHAVPDPIEITALHEPAVFFSVVLDMMALAALHELLRESPSLVSAVQAAEVQRVSPVPATVGVSPAVEPESVRSDTLERAEVTPSPVSGIPDAGTVPDPFAGVPLLVEAVRDVKDDILHHLDDGHVPDEQVQPARAAELDAPYYPLALTHFLSDVVQGEPPTVRTIKDRMSVGTDRARRLQSYLGGLVEGAR